MVRVGRLALENQTSGGDRECDVASVAALLEVVEAMIGGVVEGAELYERQLNVGLQAPEEGTA